ncbi:MAG: gamma-glutamyl-phosphate reductase, partial [Pseudanabaena sp.]
MSGNVPIDLSQDLPQDLLESIQRTRTTAITLAKLPTTAKNAALEAISIALEQQTEMILAANQKDIAAANANQL